MKSVEIDSADIGEISIGGDLGLVVIAGPRSSIG